MHRPTDGGSERHPVPLAIRHWDDRGSEIRGRETMITDFVKAATVDDIPEGEVLGVEVAGEQICLARIGGDFYAINNICSHMFTHLDAGEFYPEAYELESPLHD